MTNATFNTLFSGSVYLIDGKPFQSYHCAADDRLRCVAMPKWILECYPEERAIDAAMGGENG